MITFNTLWVIFETLNIQRLLVGTHSVLQQIGQLLTSVANKAVFEDQVLLEEGEERTLSEEVYDIDSASNKDMK